MRLEIDGEGFEVGDADHLTLLDVLRDRLELTGTKLVCDRGECGACTVLLDGEPAYSCLTLAAACEGVAVRTIEGVARDGELHPLQRAFIENDALRCGYCTPGQIMAALALLEHSPSPSESEVVHSRWSAQIRARRRSLRSGRSRSGTIPRPTPSPPRSRSHRVRRACARTGTALGPRHA